MEQAVAMGDEVARAWHVDNFLKKCFFLQTCTFSKPPRGLESGLANGLDVALGEGLQGCILITFHPGRSRERYKQIPHPPHVSLEYIYCSETIVSVVSVAGLGK